MAVIHLQSVSTLLSTSCLHRRNLPPPFHADRAFPTTE